MMQVILHVTGVLGGINALFMNNDGEFKVRLVIYNFVFFSSSLYQDGHRHISGRLL